MIQLSIKLFYKSVFIYYINFCCFLNKNIYKALKTKRKKKNLTWTCIVLPEVLCGAPLLLLSIFVVIELRSVELFLHRSLMPLFSDSDALLRSVWSSVPAWPPVCYTCHHTFLVQKYMALHKLC